MLACGDWEDIRGGIMEGSISASIDWPNSPDGDSGTWAVCYADPTNTPDAGRAEHAMMGKMELLSIIQRRSAAQYEEEIRRPAVYLGWGI